MSEPSPAQLDAAGRALAVHAGVSLSAGLAGTLRQAVAAAALERGLAPGAFAEAVAAGAPGAVELLAEHAVVHETYFWRHPEGLAVLAAELCDRAEPLAIWCAGCATGEEAYSLAMGLADAGRERRGDRILATDLSERALARARAGCYPARALRRLPASLAQRFLHPVGAEALVDERVRGAVRFARHNLLGAPPGQGFDAVACRNVLIYFEPEVARRAMARLVAALAPGGLLLLGPVELGLADGLEVEWLERGGATLLRRPGR